MAMKKLCLIAFLFVSIACNKKKSAQNVSNHPVPSVPVQLSIFPNDPLNFKIQVVGGWMYVSGGINGIVVYRKSEQEFVAVERSSSSLPSDARARVWVKSDNFTLRDTISNSEWRIFDGTVTKGPAEWPLRLYGTTYDGNLLRIVN